MKKFKNLAISLVITAVLTLIIVGCSGGSSDSDPPDEVLAAFEAINNGVDDATGIAEVPSSNWNGGNLTYHENNAGGSGTLDVTFNLSANPTVGAWTATCTFVFSNWTDWYSGYTINGTLSITMSDTDAVTASSQKITGTMTGTLTFTGALISTLTCNVTTTIVITNNNITSAYSTGTITADGKTYSSAIGGKIFSASLN